MLSTALHPFGILLKTFRKRQKISQIALAKTLDVHRNTIGGWERGDRLPEHRDIILKLAQLLELNETEQAQLLEAALFTISTHWVLPYKRNPFFTGRSDFFAKLYTKLRPSSCVTSALTGMGGLGKTQIAIEYAYRYHAEYTAIFWVTAETEETIFNSFLHIAEHLQLTEIQEQPQQRIVSAVFQWLTSHRDWLLIFDNVENCTLVKTYLPSAPFGSILLTSRLRALTIATHSIRLMTMEHEEALTFLLLRSQLITSQTAIQQVDPAIYQTADKIVNIMDGLPLALDQAGAYIERTGCRLVDYLALFQSHQLRLLDERSEAADHPLSVIKTFLLSFDRMNQTNPASADILRLCAFLAPDEIPEEMFTQGASNLGPILGPIAADAYLFNQVLGEGLQYSLLHRQAPNQTISIHRLIQIVLKATMDETTLRLWATRTMKALAASCSQIEDERIWSDYTRYLPHAQHVALLIDHLQLVSSEAGQILFMMGRYLYDHAQFEEAERFFLQSLKMWEQVYGVHHRQIALPLERLGDLYRERSLYEQAEERYLHALRIWEVAVGPDDSACALALNGLGLVYTQQGRYELATPLFQRCIQIREQTLGKEHPLTAHPLHNLGVIEQKLGHFDRAEEIYLRVLHIREQELGLNHPRVAFSYYGLGLLAGEQGHYKQAELFFNRCLQIREQAFEVDHPQVAYPLNGLGDIYQEQGHYEQAKVLLQRCLRIWEKSFGKTHHHLGFPLINLGLIALEQEDYSHAERALKRCLSIWTQSFGSEHPDLLTPLSILGTIKLKQGKLAEAEQLYRRCLEMGEDEINSKHPKLSHPLHGLGNLYQEQGKYEEAIPYYQQALAIREETLVPSHPDIAETLHEFACALVSKKDFNLVGTYYEKALTIREQVYGPDHPKTKDTKTRHTQVQQMMSGQPG